jgi:hypothetical protein
LKNKKKKNKEGTWIFSPEHYPAVIKCDGSGRETAIRLRPTRPVLILSTNGGGTIYYESLYTYDAVLRTETFDTVILFGMREPRIKPLQLEIEEKINDLWAKCHAMQQAASSKAGS